MDPGAAFDLLDSLIATGPATPGVFALDWERWREHHPGGRGPRFALARGPSQETSATETSAGHASASARLEIEAAPPERRADLLRAWLRRRVSTLLLIPEPRLEHDRSLQELGLDSLGAVELNNRIAGELGVKLSVTLLLRGASLAELSTTISERMQQATEPTSAEQSIAPPYELPQLQPDLRNRFEPFPLTEVQQAYWAGRSGDFELGNTGVYAYVEFDSPGLNVDRLERAIMLLVARHEVLRTVFLEDGSQRFLEHAPTWSLPRVDLRTLDEAAAIATLERMRGELSHQVLDATSWPLFDVRVALLPDDAAMVRVFIGFDMLIGDARSMHVLGEELVALYDHPEVELPEAPLSFRDYVLAERAHRSHSVSRAARSYWSARVPTLPLGPQLPLARKPRELDRPKFCHRSFRLPAAAWSQLKTRAAAVGLTPSGVLLAALAEVLATWARTPHFTMISTLYNRLPLHPRVDEAVGDFTSLVSLEVDHRGLDSFAGRALRLHARFLEDLEHRSIGGVEVLRELARHHGSSVVIPVNFTSMLGRVWGSWSAAGRGRVVYSVSQTPQLYIDEQVAEFAGELLVNWDVIEELFHPGMIDDMFAAMRALIEALADDEAAWDAPAQLLPSSQLDERAEANRTASPSSDARLHHVRAQVGEARAGVLVPRAAGDRAFGRVGGAPALDQAFDLGAAGVELVVAEGAHLVKNGRPKI
jgi:acyl carrier protein